jgi:hypothetical protein
MTGIAIAYALVFLWRPRETLMVTGALAVLAIWVLQ